MPRSDELRLMARVAQLYYERHVRQADIGLQLDLSQASVSRLLKRAEDEQIVRIFAGEPAPVRAERYAALNRGFFDIDQPLASRRDYGIALRR